MHENNSILGRTVSFKEFLLNDRSYRIIFYFVFVAIIIQFSIFKYYYPYASYIHDDSFVYLETAYLNLDINSYLVGYSRFLRLFSVLTNSDTALVAIQYLFIQGSSLFLLFTIFYYYGPSKITQLILICFTILNPLPLYLANLVSSDPFFLAISMTWFTLLLWIIHRPTTRLIIIHAFVLFLAFTVRYNALIYPFIAAFALYLSGLSFREKVRGILFSIILIGTFVWYTGDKYKSLTGTWQYAPFSGWQLANNAMYAYRYVKSVERKPVPFRLKALDSMVRVYFDTTRNVFKYPKEAQQASTFYMWDRSLPLYKYRDVRFLNDSIASDYKKWACMGPLYLDYGIYIIRSYPLYYMKYFLWPNAKKYYAPPIEYLEKYNAGKKEAVGYAQEWFHYKSAKVSTRLTGFKTRLLDYYPILSGIMNVVFICGLLCFIILRGFKNDTLFSKGVLLTSAIWIINAVFSIFSTAAALRFLSFPIMIMCVFAILLVDWIWKLATNFEGLDLSNIKHQKMDIVELNAQT